MSHSISCPALHVNHALAGAAARVCRYLLPCLCTGAQNSTSGVPKLLLTARCAVLSGASSCVPPCCNPGDAVQHKAVNHRVFPTRCGHASHRMRATDCVDSPTPIDVTAQGHMRRLQPSLQPCRQPSAAAAAGCLPALAAWNTFFRCCR